MKTQEEYWDKKIKEWSEASYEKKAKSPIEKLAIFFRGGITKRMDVAIKIIGSRAKGKVVVDMGCGLGDFCFEILKYKPKMVVGIDISGVAIKEAQRRVKARKLEDKVKFIKGDIFQFKKLPAFDIAVGLGFIDYLDKEDLKKLFKLLRGRNFLFSMFEKKLSLLPLLHAVYVRIQKCPGAYKYTRKEMRELIPEDAHCYFLEEDGMLFVTNTR